MSTTAEVVLVLSASARTLRKVREFGFAIVHIEDPTMAVAENAALCLSSYRQSIADVAGVVRLAETLHGTYQFVGVVTNHEPALAAVQGIADALGLPSGGAGALLRDKAAVRRALTGSSLALPWRMLASRADLDLFVRERGLPCIVKPTRGSASLGVFPVKEVADLERVWTHIQVIRAEGHRYSAVLPVHDFLVERFVDGPEFSVESMSAHGRHEILAVVEKTTNDRRVEIAHTVPARLADEDRAGVVSTVVEFLDLVGLRAGPAHTEVIIGPDGVVVIESHARTGGDGIPALVAAVTGRDSERELIGLATGRVVTQAARATATAISKRFLEVRAGTVVSVSGVNAARELLGVREVDVEVVPGDRVHDADASWWRVGEVIAVGVCAEAAEATARQAADMIRIEVV